MSTHPDLLAALAAEIASDPSQRGYAGKSAGQITALMNAPVVVASAAAHRDVSISDVEGYLRARLLVTKLRSWAEAAEAGTPREAALELLDIIASPRLQNFSTGTASGRANILGLFALLVAAGAGGMTQEHADDLAAMTLAEPGAPTTLHPRWVDVVLSLPFEVRAGLPNVVTEAMIDEALA